MRLPPINPKIGDEVCKKLELQLGQKVEIIMLVFPTGADNVQPQIVTSYPPEVAENVIEQVGKQIPLVRHSRRVLGQKAFRK